MTAQLAVVASLVALPTLVALCALGTSSSRRLLGIALACGIPVLGPLLALIAVRVRGSESDFGELELPDAPQWQLSAADVGRLAEAAPLIDRLLSSDAATRLAALTAIACDAGRHHTLLLRWAIEHGSPDAALDSALTLEELDLRREQEFDLRSRAATQRSTYDSELAAGDSAASGIFSGLADPAVIPALAHAAREHYRRARMYLPSSESQALLRLAKLELAAGAPRVALAIVETLDRGELGEAGVAMRLWERARFAARVTESSSQTTP